MQDYEFIVPAGYMIDAVERGIRDLVNAAGDTKPVATDMVLVRTIYRNGRRELRVSSASEHLITTLRKRFEGGPDAA